MPSLSAQAAAEELFVDEPAGVCCAEMDKRLPGLIAVFLDVHAHDAVRGEPAA